MKKNLTEIIFILDRSGSMYPVISDTIGGFNSTIEKQKQLNGECLVTTVLFNAHNKILHDRVDLKKIEKLTEKQYEVEGTTALLDAIGSSINHISNIHKYIREEDKPEKTMFIITTDGMENASRNFTYENVKKLINEKKQKGWEFVFLGANIDVYQEGQKFGLDESDICEYNQTSQGVDEQFTKVHKVICQIRTKGERDKSWKD